MLCEGPPALPHRSQQWWPLCGNPQSHSERHHVRRWPDPDESHTAWIDAAAKYGVLESRTGRTTALCVV